MRLLRLSLLWLCCRPVAAVDVQAAHLDGLDFVPLRYVCERLGARVTWADGAIDVATKAAKLSLSEGQLDARLNGQPLQLAAAPWAYSGAHERTPDRLRYSAWVPLSCLVSLFGEPARDARLHTATWRGVRVYCDGSVWRAAESGDLAWLRRLVAAGVRVDERDGHNHTPLMWAALGGQLAAVDWLLRAGAQVRAQTYDGDVPLNFAVHSCSAATVAWLLRGGARAGDDALFAAACGGRTSLAALLVAHGARVNAAAKERTCFRNGDLHLGDTPLHAAAQAGRPELVRWLLAHGARANTRNADGEPALLATARSLVYDSPPAWQDRSVQAAQALVEHGASLTARGPHGRTLLHLASAASREGLVRCLLDHGAAVNARDEEGRTPLAVAVGQPVKQLLQARGGRT